MQASVQQVIEQCAHKSHAGTISFGDVVMTLAQAGVESYHADYRRAYTTYYTPAGATTSIALPVPKVDIPQAFDATAVLAAIRGAQRGDVKYPEFVALTMAAGCIGYIVWIAGRHVSYFGRGGEVHIERFPDAP